MKRARSAVSPTRATTIPWLRSPLTATLRFTSTRQKVRTSTVTWCRLKTRHWFIARRAPTNSRSPSRAQTALPLNLPTLPTPQEWQLSSASVLQPAQVSRQSPSPTRPNSLLLRMTRPTGRPSRLTATVTNWQSATATRRLRRTMPLSLPAPARTSSSAATKTVTRLRTAQSSTTTRRKASSSIPATATWHSTLRAPRPTCPRTSPSTTPTRKSPCCRRH